MQTKYNARVVEQEAQRFWDDQQSFRAIEATGKPKYYCLSMFPYPSGKLHMGHVRNYTIGDVLSRYHRMRGYNVLQPMGWDAFGLPAENAAMANGMPPAKWTYDNIAYMKRQLRALGFAIDWQRELATCQPQYYRWNQWLFLRMLEKGLVYLKTGVVNWDPVDQTVLANEQVIEGRGWRTGALIEKREIPMYNMRITAYADELLAALEQLPGWPERVKVMQANWIGKSYGVRFGFPYELDGVKASLQVFTTRADTIMGVTFCAVAPEHPLALRAASGNAQVAAFVDECRKGGVAEADIALLEKKGVPTGIAVVHPLTGEQVPVWVGNYVLMAYGEGAVMGVPAHDQRDFEFCVKYGIPIKPVIKPADGELALPLEAAYVEYGVCMNSGQYDGLGYDAAVDAIAADLKAKGLGDKQVTYRLRDWAISRQRYWGCPIPIIHCARCGAVPVPDAELPVVLPEDCVPDGTGNPLAKRADFFQCKCPRCASPARRETDTMDTFVDSSWYYIRYACADQTGAMVDDRVQHWLPVDQYVGGIEHAILHLLYSRFWTKVMRDFGLVRFDEPFTNLLTQGMVLNETFYREDADARTTYFNPADVDVAHDERGRPVGATLRGDGHAVELGGIEKMSKSKNNGVDPQALIDECGADTARLFMMFASPPEQSLEWSDAGVEGANRFLRRLWDYCARNESAIRLHEGIARVSDWAQEDGELRSARGEIHKILQEANFDYGRMQFNTVASAAMKMLNVLDKLPTGPTPAGTGTATGKRPSNARLQLINEAVGILLRVLNPIVPHVTHLLWKELGFERQFGEILAAEWPEVDPAALIQEEIELVLQVNGKLRGNMRIARDAERALIERMALENPNVQKHVASQPVKKIVVVPGRLVNVVV